MDVNWCVVELYGGADERQGRDEAAAARQPATLWTAMDP